MASLVRPTKHYGRVYLAIRVRPSPTTSRRHAKFELALNLGAAKALGLIIPTTVLAIADELID